MGGAKLLGEGSGRLRPPVCPGQSPGRGPGGQSLKEAVWIICKLHIAKTTINLHARTEKRKKNTAKFP